MLKMWSIITAKYIFMYIMMKDVFIFRHGQTDKNLAQKWQGSGCDDVLNETGKNRQNYCLKKLKIWDWKNFIVLL